ncbi:MAG TPA: PIN domain-containing protein [Thermoflexales bacterium]|nr:PIN domain-containing protein [Thermoflexales bacterium]HQW35279.1 PIN domain-containing protein [Thermoflexales bacterium]HQZ98912.1 PIN domain-containing protein [Thermoflexales bacterium]
MEQTRPDKIRQDTKMVLVDSNIHIDFLNQDPVWLEWSKKQLAQSRRQGLLIVNPIIYAELSNAFDTQKELDDYFSPDNFSRLALPWNAAFLAGRAFREYRKKGGVKTAPLPDFYIGAHALVEGLTLLTRDAGRYKTYFPKLKLIAP